MYIILEILWKDCKPLLILIILDYNRNKGTSRLTERILGESKQERLKNNVKKKKVG